MKLTTPTVATAQGLLATLVSVTCLSLAPKGENCLSAYRLLTSAPNRPISFDAAPLVNGNLISLGSYGNGSFLAELGDQGEILWEKKLPGQSLERLIPLGHDHFYAVGKRPYHTGYGELEALSIVGFGVYKEKMRPFLPYSSLSKLFGFYIDVEEALITQGNSMIITGTVYGAFTGQAYFSHLPSAFMVHANPLTKEFSVEVFRNSLGGNGIYSLLHEEEHTLSSVGWSAYPVPPSMPLPYKWIPALSMMNFSHKTTFNLMNTTRLFCLGDPTTHKIIWTQGLIGLSHISTKEGGQLITGIHLDFNQSAFDRPSYHFFAMKVSKERVPIWLRVHDTQDQSAGFDLQEAQDGHYLFALMESLHNETQRVRFIKLDQESGHLLSTHKLPEPYNLTGRFILHSSPRGQFFLPAKTFTKRYSKEAVNIGFLLVKWDQNSHKCLSTDKPISLLNTFLLLAYEAPPDHLEHPPIYSLQGPSDFIETQEASITKENKGQAFLQLTGGGSRKEQEIWMIILVSGISAFIFCWCLNFIPYCRGKNK